MELSTHDSTYPIEKHKEINTPAHPTRDPSATAGERTKCNHTVAQVTCRVGCFGISRSRNLLNKVL